MRRRWHGHAPSALACLWPLTRGPRDRGPRAQALPALRRKSARTLRHKGEGPRKCSVRFPGSDDLLAGFARGSKGQVKGELPEKGSIHLGNFQKELATGRDGFRHISDLRLASEQSEGPGCVPLRAALPAFCGFLVREASEVC